GRLLELGIFFDHRVDRVLIGDLGVLLLDVGDPEADETLPQVRQTREEPTTLGHLNSPYFGSCSRGDSLTTRATASCPKNSSTSCTCNLASLHERSRAYCPLTCSSITCLTRAISAFSSSSRF